MVGNVRLLTCMPSTIWACTGRYNGVQRERILLSIRGRVLDVSKGREAYGPGGNYAMFAG